MPTATFSWKTLSPDLLMQLADDLQLTGDPAACLLDKFGPRPGVEFIRQSWPVLLDHWLGRDPQACYKLAATLREEELGDLSIDDPLDYLRSCRNAKTLRHEALQQFLSCKAPQDDEAPLEDLMEAGQAAMERLSLATLPQDPSEPGERQPADPAPTAAEHKREATATGRQNPTVTPLSGSTGQRTEMGTAAILTEPQSTTATHGPSGSDAVSEKSPRSGKQLVVMLAGLAGLSVLGLGLGLAVLVASASQHAATVQLGERRHVRPLLDLPLTAGTAPDHLQQLNQFRRSNWRHYLSSESLAALNRKGVDLNRVIETERLRAPAAQLVATPIREETLQSVESRLQQFMMLPAFASLEEGIRTRLISKQSQVKRLQLQIQERRSEAARLAREAAAEAERRRKAEEAARQAAAAAEEERARQAAAAAAEASARSAEGTESGQASDYIRGPRGGCYYWSGGSKTYVDRSYCN